MILSLDDADQATKQLTLKEELARQRREYSSIQELTEKERQQLSVALGMKPLIKKEYPWQYKQQEKVVSTENIKELLDLLTEYKLTVEDAIKIIKQVIGENSGL